MIHGKKRDILNFGHVFSSRWSRFDTRSPIHRSLIIEKRFEGLHTSRNLDRESLRRGSR